jgi:hypothetical protein
MRSSHGLDSLRKINFLSDITFPKLSSSVPGKCIPIIRTYLLAICLLIYFEVKHNSVRATLNSAINRFVMYRLVNGA